MNMIYGGTYRLSVYALPGQLTLLRSLDIGIADVYGEAHLQRNYLHFLTKFDIIKSGKILKNAKKSGYN